MRSWRDDDKSSDRHVAQSSVVRSFAEHSWRVTPPIVQNERSEILRNVCVYEKSRRGGIWAEAFVKSRSRILRVRRCNFQNIIFEIATFLYHLL